VTTLEVQLAGWDDLDQLGKVIAGAFFDLEASEWLIPDPGWRKAIYPRFFQLAYLLPGLRTGTVYCAAVRMAAAVWLPMGDPGVDPSPDPAFEAALEGLTGPFHKNFVEFDRLLHEAHVAYRDTPHDFLGVIGAHPTVWRQGSARALMHQHLTRLDEQGRPSYLEAANADLVEIWAKFGYQRTDQTITLPNGHQMFPMWREPA